MDKKGLAEILTKIGDMLEILGENPFKSRSYYNAARLIDGLTEDIEEITAEGKWQDYKGIGEALAKKITEYIRTGEMDYYTELHSRVSDSVLRMLEIPGLGPKRVRILVDKLGIKTIDQLEEACMDDHLLELEGFGKKLQDNILSGIEYIRSNSGRSLINVALTNAEDILDYLQKSKLVENISIAGSIRRRKETVKDIDILVQTRSPKKVIELFVNMEKADKVIADGETKASIRLSAGLNADLRVIRKDQFAFALHYFTGSKEHNVAMRSRAKDYGLKLNEYGLFKNKDNEKIECDSEECIFKQLELSYIPPELRENYGEISAAEEKSIPVLVEEKDIKGVIHCHSVYSDGLNTIEEMADYCVSKGYHYLVMSDHSQTASYAGGLKEKDIMEQFDEIDRINDKFKDSEFKIFKSLE